MVPRALKPTELISPSPARLIGKFFQWGLSGYDTESMTVDRGTYWMTCLKSSTLPARQRTLL